MNDATGTPIKENDFVRWRYITDSRDSFNYVGIVCRINIKTGLIIVKSLSLRYQEQLYKGPQNIKKMTDGEIMLWKLENV